jgi:(S)-mandelate dehydrogenase
MPKLSRAVSIEDLRRMAQRWLPRSVFDFFDGGVRRGVDILKARALGARAVLTGRATLFGVMAGGEPGAKRAIDILGGEFERAMQLCGVRRAEDIGAELLAQENR